MFKKTGFAVALIALGIAFYFNPNFKTIASGVAILLFGMMMLERGFKVFTNGPLKQILKNATNKLYKSISLGALVTALMQSSSLVSVITISFISAGLIDLAGGLGLIFGANIGSTATAWLVAGFGLKIKISALALPMLVFGLIFSFQKKDSYKGIGNVLAGLGFFFLGIHFMKEGFDIFSKDINLMEYAVPGFSGVLIYTGIGIIITIVLQSSAATLVLVLTALAAGQIGYENALALAIGANVGTTITAVLGAVSANIAGKRLAGAHLIFNIITGLVAIAFIFPLARLVNNVASVLGISASNYTLKLALFHTVFNVIGVLIMIPFIKKLEKLLTRVFKEKKPTFSKPVFLNESVLMFPETTIVSLLKETKHLYINPVFEIVAHSINLHREDIKSEVKHKIIVQKSTKNLRTNAAQEYYLNVKLIYGEILRYATTVQNDFKLNDLQIKKIAEIKVANRKMVELIRDVGELNKNVVAYSENDNPSMQKVYAQYRKKLSKVLRTIYLFRTEEASEVYYLKLKQLKKEAKENARTSTKLIDKLIRKNLITAPEAASVFNDNDNVNDISRKLIEVAELLYGGKDSLFEPLNDSDEQEELLREMS